MFLHSSLDDISKVSGKPAKAGKSKTKQQTSIRKTQSMKEESSNQFPGSCENNLKLESSGVKQEDGDQTSDDRKPDALQFNGHLDQPGKKKFVANQK